MNNVMQNQTIAAENEATKGGKMMNLQSRFLVWKFHKSQEIKEILSNNKGLGIVEIALIIVVIVALAFLFKDKVTALLTKIMDSVDASNLGSRP